MSSDLPNWTQWADSITPGAPPPSPSNRTYSPPPSSVYPHSSTSNADPSRYRRERAQSTASSQPQGSYHSQAQSHHSRSSSQYSKNRPPPSRAYTVDSARRESLPVAKSGSTSGTRTTTSKSVAAFVHRDKHLPVVARTTSSDGRTGGWIIIPPDGQSVEVMDRQQFSYSGGHRIHNASLVSSPTRSNSSGRTFDIVESGRQSKNTTTSHHSSSRRSRRNSEATGTSSVSHSASWTSHTSSWTVTSDGREVTGSGHSVSTVKAGRRKDRA